MIRTFPSRDSEIRSTQEIGDLSQAIQFLMRRVGQIEIEFVVLRRARPPAWRGVFA